MGSSRSVSRMEFRSAAAGAARRLPLDTVAASRRTRGAVAARADDAQLERRIDDRRRARHRAAARRRPRPTAGSRSRSGPRNSGRSPPASAPAIQSISRPTARLAEHAAVLRRREVLAEQPLHPRQAGRERREFGAGRAGQHAHQHLVADLGGSGARQWRQRRERGALVGRRSGRGSRGSSTSSTRHAGRQFDPAQHRPPAAPSARGPPSSSSPPCSKPAMPMPERRPRPVMAGELGGGQPGAGQFADGAADRQRELRSRAEAGMRRQHAAQQQLQRRQPRCRGERRTAAERLRWARGARQFGRARRHRPRCRDRPRRGAIRPPSRSRRRPARGCRSGGRASPPDRENRGAADPAAATSTPAVDRQRQFSGVGHRASPDRSARTGGAEPTARQPRLCRGPCRRRSAAARRRRTKPGPGAHRPGAGAASLDLHADRVDIVELARLGDPHPNPGGAELVDRDAGNLLRQRLEQRHTMFHHQALQSLAQHAVVDRIDDLVGVAGARPRQAGADIDHQRLRPMQLAVVDADHRLRRRSRR